MTSKGRVTIPADIRTAFNLNAGDKLFFVPEGNQFILIPVREKRPSELVGCLPATESDEKEQTDQENNV